MKCARIWGKTLCRLAKYKRGKELCGTQWWQQKTAWNNFKGLPEGFFEDLKIQGWGKWEPMEGYCFVVFPISISIININCLFVKPNQSPISFVPLHLTFWLYMSLGIYQWLFVWQSIHCGRVLCWHFGI